MVKDDGGFPSELSAEVVDDFEDIFAEEKLRETDSGSPSSANYRSGITTALQQLSKIVPTSGDNFKGLIPNLFDDIKSSQEAITETQNEVGQQKRFVYVSEKSAGEAHDNITGLRERVTDSDWLKAELSDNNSAAWGKIARTATELRQVRDTISIQSKVLTKAVNVKTSVKNLEDNVVFYKVTEEELKGEIGKTTAESTCRGQFYDRMRVQVVDMHEKLAAKEAAIKENFQD